MEKIMKKQPLNSGSSSVYVNSGVYKSCTLLYLQNGLEYFHVVLTNW
jgi:hypothetical protein